MKFLKHLDNLKVQTIGVFLLLLFFSIRSYFQDTRMEEYKEIGSYTLGEIIDHNVSGYNENYYIKYLYYVDDLAYTKSEHYSKKYRGCHEDRMCIGLKFIVYFNPENPKDAFIDFNDER